MRSSILFTFAALVFQTAIWAVAPQEARAEPPQRVVVTSPLATDIVVSQQYPGLIHSQRHIEVYALSAGYLESVPIREGQAVKEGDVLFKVLPTLYKAKLDAELAEVQLAKLELANAKKLFDKKVVSEDEVKLFEAKLAKAQAKAKVAQTELDFTTIRAPFDGLIGRLETQVGSLVNQEKSLTTLSDNSVMWVYFPVPEARYLQFKARYHVEEKKAGLNKDEKVDQQARVHAFLAEFNKHEQIVLVLADGSTFPEIGKLRAIGGQFNNETGNIRFRADFPNPDRLLRHGQTGTVLIRRTLKNATVIPQRATFEILDRRYVYVVGKDDVVHQREIAVEHEVDDVFVIKKGLDVNDRIVLEGIRRVRDGEKIECEFRKPEPITGSSKVRQKK